jgi:hypothetical protein
MAKVNLRCGCGMFFFGDITDEQPSARCPSCGQEVGLQGPMNLERRRTKVITTKPAAVDDGKKKLIIMGSAAGGVVLLLVLMLLVVGPGKGSTTPTGPDPATAVTPVTAPAPAPVAPRPAPAPLPAPVPAPLPAPVPAPVPAAVPAPLPVAPATPSTPLPAAVPPSPEQPLPEEVVAEVRKALAMHPYYVGQIFGAHRARVDKLLAAGKGHAADRDFLRGIVEGEIAQAAQAEIGLVRSEHVKLELSVVAEAPVDKVLLTDGRVLQGKVLSEDAEGVKFERKQAGVGGIMPFRREMVKEVQKGKGVGAEFLKKWEEAKKGSVAQLMAFMGWCKDNGMAPAAKLAAYQALLIDPGHAPARGEAGLPLILKPVPAAAAPAVTGGGGATITYEGRAWEPMALRQKLERDGYVVLNGEWYGRKERIVSVPGLFKYEKETKKPVTITGPLSFDADVVSSSALDATSKAYKDVEQVNIVRRFYAPALAVRTYGVAATESRRNCDVNQFRDSGAPAAGSPLAAEVTIDVPLEAPLIEGSVMTRAEVEGGGSIEVFLVQMPGGQRTRLYSCSGKDSASRKLPPAVLGWTRLTLVASIRMQAAYTSKREERLVRPPRFEKNTLIQVGLVKIHDRLIPDYKAVLFPSNSNTVEIFRLNGDFAEPAPSLNKLFQDAGATNVLRQ